jgi:hypothetical protein
MAIKLFVRIHMQRVNGTNQMFVHVFVDIIGPMDVTTIKDKMP